MPQELIPLVPDQKSGWEALAGAQPLAVNCFLDGSGAVYRRPGIADYDGALDAAVGTAPLVGLWETLDGTLLAVDSEAPQRHIYRLTSGATTLLTGDLNGTDRPIFAETEAMVVIAGGGEMQKVPLPMTSPTSERLGGSPPKASHVAALFARLVSNDLISFRSQFAFSGLAIGSSTTGHETWSGVGTGRVTAEARPDKVVALAESTSELFVFGERTTEVYTSDSVFVFSRVQAQEVGCGAPYSVVKVDQTQFWLDHLRRFVASDGRSLQVLSEPIQATLDKLSAVADCFGYRVRTGPLDCIVWTFPADGRSFVYQFNGGWSTWMGWDAANTTFNRFPVNCHVAKHATGDNIVGLTTGRVVKLSMDANDDLGTNVVARIDTGHVNRGTDNRKHCKAVYVALRRGQTTGAGAPHAFLRYREGLGPWSSPLRVGFGRSGDTEAVVALRSLGVYRRRQWRFEYSDGEPLVLASMTEDYDILSN